MANLKKNKLIFKKRNSIIQAIKYTIIYSIIGFFWAVAYDNNTIYVLESGISIDNIHISELLFLSLSAVFLFFSLKQYSDLSNNSETYAETVFENSSSAILVCDRQGNIIQANNACVQLTQYSITEIKTKNYLSLIPAPGDEKIKAIFSTLKVNSTSSNIETLLINGNGLPITTNCHSKCVMKNGLELVLVFCDETTPIKKLMNESKKNEELFTSIFKLVPVGMQIINLDTSIRLNINQHCCKILGDSATNLLGKNAIEQGTWKDKKELNYMIKELNENKKLHNYVTEIINRKGEHKNIALDVTLLEHSKENLALVCLTDITEQIKTINNISALAHTISYHSDSTFYDFAIKQIAKLFKSSHAFIGIINKKNSLQMDTIAYCVNEQISPNFSYNLNNTPCLQVTKNEFCYFPNNVQELFPKDFWFTENNIQSYIGIPLCDLKDNTIGGLILLFDHPITLNDYWIDIVKIFSAKITSELKHQEQNKQTLATQQHLNLYREQAPLASIEWDTNFNLQSCNQATEEMLGYSLDELKKIDFIAQLVPKNEQNNVEKICTDLLAETGGKRSVNSIFTKENKIILTEWHNALIKDDSNTNIGAISIVKNITKENKFITKLAEKEKENREILNTMVDAVITINDRGEILTINAATIKMFGYSEQELIGNNICLLMPKSIAIKHDNYIKNYQKTKKAQIIGIGRELIALRKNLQEFPIRLSLSELSPDENCNTRYVGTCHDLSEIKRQQNALQRVQKMDALGKLTGGISHDFNNILGVILGFGELLEQQLSQQPILATYCRQIVRASERGCDLTRKLLSFSKQQNKQTEIININDLLNAIEPMLAKTLTPIINIKYNLANNLWNANIDINAFDDAVLNLCINAKYAMSAGGLLSISTLNISFSDKEAKQQNLIAGDYICFTVTDNGCGMSDEVKLHLFDPFYTTKGTDDTGLGLSQVYGFVKASHGRVNVYSEENIGSTFSLYFPRYSSNSSNSSNSTQKKSTFSGNENILVVDDEIALGLLAKTILEDKGYTVYQADSAKKALNLLAETSIDLLLTDIIMPEMNGYELVEKIRSTNTHLPIIFASGFAGENNIAENKFSDISLISKPYNSNTLLSNIRRLLDSPTDDMTELKTKQKNNVNNLNNLLNTKTTPSINLFDAAHKKIKELLQHFSTLNNKIDGNNLTNEKLSVLENEFLKTIEAHFIDEEKIMALTHYPYKKNHVMVHQLLLKELNQAINTKNPIEFLLWVNEHYIEDYYQHISFMDKSLIAFLALKNIDINTLLAK